MSVSRDVKKASWTVALNGWAKVIASRIVGSEPCPNDKKFEQIARDQNRSAPKSEVLEPGRREPGPIFPLCC
jgi:hypothetical protein